MDVLATNIGGLHFDVCQSLLHYVGQQRQERIRKFRRPDDAIRCLFGELLIRVYAAEEWGIAHRDCILHTDKYQKPYLVNHTRRHFNVSHSGSWVVAAFDNTKVGIDIEQIVPIDLAMTNMFFAPEEVEQLENQPSIHRLSYFYRLWTLKESYIKADGKGLSIPLDSFRFNLTEDTIHFYSKMDSNIWSFSHFPLDPNYKLAVCGYGSKATFPNQVRILPPEEIICRFKRAIVMA